MTSTARLAVYLHVLFVLATAVVAQEPPFAFQAPGVNPDEFRLTTFATGVGYPVGMVLLDDGSILIGATDGNPFFNAGNTGRIIRFVDADQDGVADQEDGEILIDGLPGGIAAVRRAGNLILCTGQRNPPITILRLGDNPSDPLTQVGEIKLNYPAGGWLHPHSALGVRQTPGETERWDIVFQLGSDTNFAVTTRTVNLTSDIGISGTLNGDAVHMVTIRDTGDAVVGENLIQLASGLRNAAGFAFHPETGDLYIQDNGIDGLQNANEPHSADELNVILAVDIGGDIEDFGFPGSYERYRTKNVVGGDILPLFAFHPLPDPQTGDEGEGPNDIAFPPPAFPAPLSQGIFVTMHGKFSLGGLANEENPLIFANLETGEYFHFVGVDEPDVGHLDGLLATENSLFIADISPPGGFGQGGTGIIYQLQYGASLFPSGDVGERYDAVRVDLLDPPIEIALDGATDEEAWERAPFHPLLERWKGGLDESRSASDADFTPSFAAVADSDFLYLAWRIADDILQDQEEGCRAFHDDSMEIYVDLGHERSDNIYDENDAEIIIGARNLQGDGDPNNLSVGIFKRGNCVGDHAINDETQLQVVCGAVSELPPEAELPGWQGEVAIALKSSGVVGNWDVTPDHGVQIGFDVHMTDDDDGGDQGNTSKAQIWSLADSNSQAWGNPQVFGTLRFTELGRAVAAPEAIFTITPLEGEAPLEICVDASASRVPAGVEIVSWDWDFAGTAASGKTTCHTFESPGSLVVTLTVTADNGKVSSTTQNVVVQCATGDVAPWQTAVLGTPSLGGGSSLEGGVLELCGGGDHLAGDNDAFPLVYQAAAGDAVFTAQIEALEGELDNALLGVMFRESLTPDARFVTSSTRRGISERYACFWRPETGADLTFRGRVGRTAGPPNNWVRLERQGDEFIAFASDDGAEWKEYRRLTLDGFPEEFFAGFFLVSDAPAEGSFDALIARFANFSLEHTPGVETHFVRGDCDGDGNACTGVNDALTLLNWLFQGSAAPGCVAACNTDGVGGIELTDAVFGLNFCFAGLLPPPSPRPDCGAGELPDDETLGCAAGPAACN